MMSPVVTSMHKMYQWAGQQDQIRDGKSEMIEMVDQQIGAECSDHETGYQSHR